MTILPTFIRDVRVCDESFDEAASHALISISPEQYTMIKKAQRFLKKLDGYSVSIFDYTPEYMDTKRSSQRYGTSYLVISYSNDDSKTTDQLTPDDLTPNEDMILECLELKITADDIFWSGSIKHTTVEVFTESISIKELDHNFKVLAMPLDELPILINHAKFKSSKLLAKRRLANECPRSS